MGAGCCPKAGTDCPESYMHDWQTEVFRQKNDALWLISREHPWQQCVLLVTLGPFAQQSGGR